jgi:hypothetical protein
MTMFPYHRCVASRWTIYQTAAIESLDGDLAVVCRLHSEAQAADYLIYGGTKAVMDAIMLA